MSMLDCVWPDRNGKVKRFMAFMGGEDSVTSTFQYSALRSNGYDYILDEVNEKNLHHCYRNEIVGTELEKFCLAILEELQPSNFRIEDHV